MSDGLSLLPAFASGSGYSWYSPVAEVSLSPIFSVRNYTSSALSRLLRPSCNWGTFLDGRGVCLYVALA
jgi:hypothetical protein